MDDLKAYPISCRKNIRKLMDMLSADAETVYSIMENTASIMGVNVNDDRVVNAILMDCGTENVK